MLKQGMEPVHPGQILKNLFLEPLGLGPGETAKHLGVSRKTLSMLINERQGISAEMALRLAKAFDTTPSIWINMQNNYDLWHAARKVKLSGIKRIYRSKVVVPEEVTIKVKSKSVSTSNARGRRSIDLGL